MPDDPPADLLDTDLLTKIGGPAPQSVLDILKDFAGSFPAFLATLETHLAAQAFPAAVDLLHRQKGAAASLGLSALQAALAETERDCERGNPAPPGALTTLRSLAEDSIEAARIFLASL